MVAVTILAVTDHFGLVYSFRLSPAVIVPALVSAPVVVPVSPGGVVL